MPTQQYYAQPLEDDGDDYLDQMDPTEMARMQQMMMKQQVLRESMYLAPAAAPRQCTNACTYTRK